MKTIIILILSIVTNLLFAQNEKYLDPTSCPFQFGSSTTITKKGDGYVHPRISPDGTKAIVTKENYEGVYVIDLKNPSHVTTVTKEYMAGFDAKWSKDGNDIMFKNYVKLNEVNTSRNPLRYSVQQKTITSDDISNTKSENTSKVQDVTVAYNLSRRIVEATDGSKTWDITKSKGSYFDLIVSPDKSKVLIHKSGNMYIYAMDGSGMLCCLGHGLCQSWSPDGKYVLYFISSDNGYVTDDSDIYICTSDGFKKWKMTNTPDKIELWPYWSPKGDIIIYDDAKSETLELIRVIKK